MKNTNKKFSEFNSKKGTKKSAFEKFAHSVTKASGSSIAFFSALLIIIVWLITGPIFDYSDTWQLIINTGTTIVTFLMVFLIQKSQNRDSLMFQLKLNELIAAQKGASNRLLDIEDLSEEELETLIRFYVTLSRRAKTDASLIESHSIEEAEELHHEKLSVKKGGKSPAVEKKPVAEKKPLPKKPLPPKKPTPKKTGS